MRASAHIEPKMKDNCERGNTEESKITDMVIVQSIAEAEKQDQEDDDLMKMPITVKNHEVYHLFTTKCSTFLFVLNLYFII